MTGDLWESSSFQDESDQDSNDDAHESPDESHSASISSLLDVRNLALHRIAVREYGARELGRYLVRKGASPAHAAKVVMELVSDGRIDDRRYAQVIARHEAFRDKGPAYILSKLWQKGVKLSLSEVQQLYQESLPEASDSELQMARKVLERRYPHAFEDRAEAKRAYAALLRRGFSCDVVQKCLFSHAEDDAD